MLKSKFKLYKTFYLAIEYKNVSEFNKIKANLDKQLVYYAKLSVK